MNLVEAKALGRRYPDRKRIGRGIGSGIGKTSGRGHKGAKARTGWSRKLGWEGGQMPLYRRMPKIGFNNKIFKKVYTVINVSALAVFEDGAVVDLQAVLHKGLTSKEKQSELFKVLGDGKLEKRLTVRADAVTPSAQAKIEQAGGKVELIPQRVNRPKWVRKDGSSSKPVTAKPAASSPAPAAAPPVADKAPPNAPVADKPKADKPKGDKPKTDKPKSDKPKSDKPKSDKPDKPRAEKPKPDQPPSDEPR